MGNPTPAYLLKRDQEMRDIKAAIAEAEKRKQTEESITVDVDKSTTQPK
jgi:hypothetical protein